MAFLVAPTSPDERIEAAAQASSGFLYCVTLTGVTGARGELASGLEPMLRRVRSHTDLPVVAGFGISRPEHVRALAGLADGAAVGSALMEAVHQGADTIALVKELVSACQ